jgi:glutamyl-tRNA reductase
VVVIGAGETSRLAAQHLGHYFPGAVTIVNRSRDRGAALAAEIGGRAMTLDQLADAIADADLVVSATRAPATLLSAATVAEVMASRSGRPMTIVDLAVPRDVEPEAGAISSVTLHSIDAIQGVVDRSLAHRASEVPRVEAIVHEEALKFDGWKRSLDAMPVVRDLREHFERVRLEELERALGNASGEERARADRLTRALVNRLLHLPTVRLKDVDPASDEGASRLRAAREAVRARRRARGSCPLTRSGCASGHGRAGWRSGRRITSSHGSKPRGRACASSASRSPRSAIA